MNFFYFIFFPRQALAEGCRNLSKAVGGAAKEEFWFKSLGGGGGGEDRDESNRLIRETLQQPCSYNP